MVDSLATSPNAAVRYLSSILEPPAKPPEVVDPNVAVLKVNPRDGTSWLLEATRTGLYTMQLQGPLRDLKGYSSEAQTVVPVEQQRRLTSSGDGARVGDVLCFDVDGTSVHYYKPDFAFNPQIDLEAERFDTCPYPGREGDTVMMTLRHKSSGAQNTFAIRMDTNPVMRQVRTTISRVS